MTSLTCHVMLPPSGHGEGSVTALTLPVYPVCLSSTLIFACIILTAVAVVAAADVRNVSGTYADGNNQASDIIKVIEGSSSTHHTDQHTSSISKLTTIPSSVHTSATGTIVQRRATKVGQENPSHTSHWSFLQAVKKLLENEKHGRKFSDDFGYSLKSSKRNKKTLQYSSTKDDTTLSKDAMQGGQLGNYKEFQINNGLLGTTHTAVTVSTKPNQRLMKRDRSYQGKHSRNRFKVTGVHNNSRNRFKVTGVHNNSYMHHQDLKRTAELSKHFWILPGTLVESAFNVLGTPATTWPLYGKGDPYFPTQTQHHAPDDVVVQTKHSDIDHHDHLLLPQQPRAPHLTSADSKIMTSRPKRKSRSVDNEPGGSGPVSEDILLTEALHHIDDLRSQTAPCPNGSRIILLKPMKLSPRMFQPVFADVVNKTVQMANMISDLLMFTDTSPEFFLDLFFVMTQSLVEAGPQVRGCAIAVNLTSGATPTGSTPTKPQRSMDPPVGPEAGKNVTYRESLFPYAYRTQAGEVVVTDLSKVYRFNRTNWYSYHVNRSADGLLKPRDRIFTDKTDVGVLWPYLGRWNKAVSVTPEDGFWARPYYDCLLENWVVQYSVPFYQQKGNRPEFKGVVLLEANLETIPINQCDNDGGLFSGSHRCIRSSTECKNIPSAKLQAGNYQCVCKDGYRFPSPNSASQFFQGRAVERAYLEFVRNISSNYTNDFSCMPMPTTPPSTTPLGGEGEPIVAFDFLARGVPLGIQSFCMTVSVVIGIVILCFRKTKVMRSSIWVLLEMLLFGAVLLYATVVIQYFEPTTLTCLLLPWCREMGFAIVYGVLVLKIYRILAEFQSRKAHRVHVRDKDLLKYLAVILTVVIAYMSAWTAVNMDHLSSNSTILERLHTKDNKAYTLCRAMWWDYVIEAGEFIFLCFGIYMCYCVRSAPTEYSEGRFITGAISYEAAISTIFYVLRHLWWYKMHPDHLFLMFFLRCQLTVTVVLLIILGPKLWYAHRPPDEDHGRSRAYSQSDVQDSSSPETMKLNVGISSNGDVEVGEISLTEMDPEDIRAELKRLYTQLQIYKTKTMRKDNPHISKRRGGRKQTHRRFSLQAFHHKHRHHHDHDHEHEMSKTPEESTNSAEAMAFTIEPSVKEDPNEGRSVPSVSFKPGHK